MEEIFFSNVFAFSLDKNYLCTISPSEDYGNGKNRKYVQLF